MSTDAWRHQTIIKPNFDVWLILLYSIHLRATSQVHMNSIPNTFSGFSPLQLLLYLQVTNAFK